MASRLPRFVQSAALFALLLPAAPARAEDDPEYDGKKGSEWVKVLTDDPSARKRSLAVEALAKLWADKRYKDAPSNIGRALRIDGSAAVRTQAALAIGAFKDVDVKDGYGLDDLVTAMGTEKESRVRKEIARAIARFKLVPELAVTQLAGALKDPDAGTRQAVVEALGLASVKGKSAASELAPLLADQDKAVRIATVVALGRINPEGASAIAETMAKMLGSEKDADMKAELITALGLFAEKSPTVVAALASLLTDPTDELRRRATRTLGTFGTAAAPAADALLKVASTDRAKDIRVDAVHGYSSAVGTDLKKHVKNVIALLQDPDFEVRLAVVDEIGSLGYELIDDKETMKVLRGRLSDPHLKVREASANAIKKIEKKPEPKKDPEPKD